MMDFFDGYEKYVKPNEQQAVTKQPEELFQIEEEKTTQQVAQPTQPTYDENALVEKITAAIMAKLSTQQNIGEQKNE